MSQFLMKNGKVAFTVDYATLITDAKGRVVTALHTAEAKPTKRNIKRMMRASHRLGRLQRVANR